MAKEKKQPRLKKKYEKEIIPAMMEEFELENKMALPRIEKISINVGVGKIGVEKNTKAIEQIAENITAITGQKPIITKSKKSIASFKLREGMDVGMKVTMRGNRMYEFLDRLISIALPRIRDFRGLNPNSFDGQGNYSLGINEHVVFPEVKIENTESIHGLQITIKLNKKDKKMGRGLLEHFGFPFKK